MNTMHLAFVQFFTDYKTLCFCYADYFVSNVAISA